MYNDLIRILFIHINLCFIKKIFTVLTIILLYQTPLYSKSNSFDKIDSNILSNYFSGIVASENKNSSEALNYFSSSKLLINDHDPYLEKFVMSLVLENKVNQAINIIKLNSKKSNTVFFESYILLILDSIKKKNFNKASELLEEVPKYLSKSRINLIILDSLKQYVYVFHNKKILKNNQNYGNLSFISETFLRCHLGDNNTNSFFSQLINSNEGDYSRYIYFYLSHLVENNEIKEAKDIIEELNYINTTLLLSQGKSWIENNKFSEFGKVFSCTNHNDILGEFIFLISNLYSSTNDYEKSNFYLSLSNYLNPKFIFNLSLVAENLYLNGNYEKSKQVLKKFDKNQNFYYWYRLKKETQIISQTKNKKEALNYINLKFQKLEKPNIKFIFDIANFHKNAQEYHQAIEYYSLIINSLDDNIEIKSDLLYRRGSSFERLKNYSKADEDLLSALKIDPGDAYILNYLAYSWLERDYRIDEAIKMLERAYAIESDDPYIIDSIGWAYYLIQDYDKAENFINRAIQLMPNDPIVNDHYGDILWKLNRKIQARYFWSMVLKMDDVEEELIDQIQNKLIQGPKNS